MLLHFPVEDQVAICLEERVPVLSFFWGDPTPYVGRAHAAGVKVFHQVGSVADARGVVAVLALGAQAAVLGTRFLASADSRAHPHYKQKVLEAGEGDTVRTTLFGHGWPNAPHRTLRTAFVRQWLGQEARGQESRPDEPAVGQTVVGGQPMPVLRFMGLPPNRDASGDIESMDLLAGQGVGLVGEIRPAGQIVRDLVEEARRIVTQRLTGLAASGVGSS